MSKTINIASAGGHIIPVDTGRTTIYLVDGITFYTYGHAIRAAISMIKANNSRSN